MPLKSVVEPFVSTKNMRQIAAELPGASRPANRRGYPLHWLTAAFTLVLLTVPACAVEAKAQTDYKKIVVFGDSLSDTGNVAHLTEAKYGVRIPGLYADYADGRFTDGAYTAPAAQKYFGVWIEQYAATLPSKPKIKASLDGGTDYAYGFATTGSGAAPFTFGPSNSLSVNVSNIGQQITKYLKTHPKIDDKTLFVVWGGAIDLLYAKSTDDVIDAGINQTLNIQRLVDAGATQFIVPNLPPLGSVPKLNGSSATSVPATEASVLYNDVLGAGLAVVQEFNSSKHVKITLLDVFSLFNKIIASPAKYSLVDVTSSSQGEPVDPDTYLFWDDLHPTTRGHNILALAVESAVASKQCTKIFADPLAKQDDFEPECVRLF
jgi:outer membrane lipase/esterase